MKKGRKAVGPGRWALLCIGLAAVLAACSARSGSPVPGSQPEPSRQESPASSAALPASQPSSAAGSLPEQEEETPLQPGTVLALGDARRPAFPEGAPTLAAQDEQQRWEEMLHSGGIARLDAGGMNESERELAAEDAQALLKILQAAELGFYQEAGNPPTGGAESVYAYGADGARLFSASYNGEWLSVHFGEEDAWYIFNAEESGLEALAEYIEG